MTKNNNTDNGAEVKEQLFKIINAMSEEEQRSLLSALGEKRQYPRKPYIVAVDYQIDDETYQGFIFDISAGGVFIETTSTFTIGAKISLTFSISTSYLVMKISSCLGDGSQRSFNGFSISGML